MLSGVERPFVAFATGAEPAPAPIVSQPMSPSHDDPGMQFRRVQRWRVASSAEQSGSSTSKECAPAGVIGARCLAATLGLATDGRRFSKVLALAPRGAAGPPSCRATNRVRGFDARQAFEASAALQRNDSGKAEQAGKGFHRGSPADGRKQTAKAGSEGSGPCASPGFTLRRERHNIARWPEAWRCDSCMS